MVPYSLSSKVQKKNHKDVVKKCGLWGLGICISISSQVLLLLVKDHALSSKDGRIFTEKHFGYYMVLNGGVGRGISLQKIE